MRLFAWSLMLVTAFAIGCNQPVETIPSVSPSSSGTTDAEEAHDHEHAEGEADTDGSGASTSTPELIRFVADQKIKVPGMMCPYSCWPKVKETLAAQPGVEGVQLAEQPAGTSEGEIVERVVELKLNSDFNVDAAVAALQKVNFDAEIVN
jgi:hypothetical protein